jgi:hypothetical protein
MGEQNNARIMSGSPMEKAPSSEHAKAQRSRWAGLMRFLLNACIVISVFGLFIAFRDYDDRHSERSAVAGIVDHWSPGQGKGDVGFYYIKVTLPDGSKVSAKATPFGPPPPEAGKQIELVKIKSVLGFTSYRWERPLVTFTPMPLDPMPSTSMEPMPSPVPLAQ